MAEETVDVKIARLEEKVDAILNKISDFVTVNTIIDDRLRKAETEIVVMRTEHAQREKNYKDNIDKLKFYMTIITIIFIVIEFLLKWVIK